MIMNKEKFTDKELALIQALVFYHPGGLTEEFEKIHQELLDRLNTHEVVGKFNIWK